MSGQQLAKNTANRPKILLANNRPKISPTGQKYHQQQAKNKVNNEGNRTQTSFIMECNIGKARPMTAIS